MRLFVVQVLVSEDRQDANDWVRRTCSWSCIEAEVPQVDGANAGDEVTCLKLRRRRGVDRTTRDAISVDW